MSAKKTLHPLVLVDVALFCLDERGLRVLLVKRAQEPEIGRWALPGGILKPEVDKSLEDAALRTLSAKVRVEIPHLQEVCTFSGPNRDPRDWSVSVLHYALLPSDQINELVQNKIEALEWADAARPGHRLAFDHAKQLEAALAVLREKVERHALPLHLMPPLFTLTALQRTCEAILDRTLDKAVFRRRIKGSPDLVPTDQYETGLQRPAQLHRGRNGFVF